MKAFLAFLILIGVDQRNSYELYWTTIGYIALADAFYSLTQVSVGSGVKEARSAEKCGRRHWTTRPWNSTPYSIVAYIHPSLSTYLKMAFIVPKPNRQLPINGTSVNKLIICCCQQPSSVAVNKLFNYRRSLTNLTQTNHLFKNDLNEATQFSKEIINQLCILYCVLCITALCCANNQVQICSIKIFLFS